MVSRSLDSSIRQSMPGTCRHYTKLVPPVLWPPDLRQIRLSTAKGRGPQPHGLSRQVSFTNWTSKLCCRCSVDGCADHGLHATFKEDARIKRDSNLRGHVCFYSLPVPQVPLYDDAPGLQVKSRLSWVKSFGHVGRSQGTIWLCMCDTRV